MCLTWFQRTIRIGKTVRFVLVPVCLTWFQRLDVKQWEKDKVLAPVCLTWFRKYAQLVEVKIVHFDTSLFNMIPNGFFKHCCKTFCFSTSLFNMVPNERPARTKLSKSIQLWSYTTTDYNTHIIHVTYFPTECRTKWWFNKNQEFDSLFCDTGSFGDLINRNKPAGL